MFPSTSFIGCTIFFHWGLFCISIYLSCKLWKSDCTSCFGLCLSSKIYYTDYVIYFAVLSWVKKSISQPVSSTFHSITKIPVFLLIYFYGSPWNLYLILESSKLRTHLENSFGIFVLSFFCIYFRINL